MAVKSLRHLRRGNFEIPEGVRKSNVKLMRCYLLELKLYPHSSYITVGTWMWSAAKHQSLMLITCEFEAFLSRIIDNIYVYSSCSGAVYGSTSALHSMKPYNRTPSL